jgi:hypothetical protein
MGRPGDSRAGPFVLFLRPIRVHENGLPHLRSSLKQPTLHKAVPRPSIRLVDETGAEDAEPQLRPKKSIRRLSLQGIPILVAVISTSLLAYSLLSGQGTGPQAQLQQEAPQAVTQNQPAQPTPQNEVAQQNDYQVVQVGEQLSAPKPAEAAAPPAMPTDDVLLMLIQSYLIALNQANATGNYTVLRDLAAPGFQEVNSVGKLAEIFAQIRNAKIDISPILLFQPKLWRKPEFNDKGRLRVTGFFPTEPQRVNFDLILEFVGGKWRLYALSVGTSAPKPPQPSATSVGPLPAGQPDVTTVTVTPQAVPPTETSRPIEDSSVSTVTVTPQVPPDPTPAGRPKPKPKPAAASESPPEPDLDVRDRIDNPPAPAPEEKPKEKSFWNPFSR